MSKVRRKNEGQTYHLKFQALCSANLAPCTVAPVSRPIHDITSIITKLNQLNYSQIYHSCYADKLKIIALSLLQHFCFGGGGYGPLGPLGSAHECSLKKLSNNQTVKLECCYYNHHTKQLVFIPQFLRLYTGLYLIQVYICHNIEL